MLGNGDGLTIYNGTTPTDLGVHDFTYRVSAYNNDVLLDSDVTKTNALLVQVRPTVYAVSILAAIR